MKSNKNHQWMEQKTNSGMCLIPSPPTPPPLPPQPPSWNHGANSIQATEKKIFFCVYCIDLIHFKVLGMFYIHFSNERQEKHSNEIEFNVCLCMCVCLDEWISKMKWWWWWKTFICILWNQVKERIESISIL